MPANHGRPSDLPPMEQIAALVRQHGLAAVAEDLDCSLYSLRSRLNRAGYTITGRPRHTTHDSKPDDDTDSRPPSLTWEAQPWADNAYCAQTDPELWFPEKGGSTREAKSVCAQCTVAAECLDYALDHNERFGIWGGLSERERRRITRHQATA